ncbi:MAG: hypothetical protein ACO1NM_03290 [Sphingobium phenoxybenzoativorans]|uniref:Uncharacterized protein n=1 Tax=Sphingobium phenoxybenzoativorans TaxID=1592790 RepID=A0A975KBP5_9SPHN|nr:hypothetical protein [Sphingobium phenoxybenzoativorans]QUT08438.1 hypothetical protein KFK14_23585 [Sphingobium phenoxybenzoativorans]
MIAFFKSDMFRNFAGGFVLGTIGILALQMTESHHDQPAKPSAGYSSVVQASPPPASVKAAL